MLGMIIDQNYSVLIDLSCTKSFISSAMLKIIKVKEVGRDEFNYVEMESGAK
jgi:hypothetical protein